MAIQPGHNYGRGPRRAILAFVFIAPFLGFFLVRVNLVLALAPIFLSHVLLLYGTLVPNCHWFGPVFGSFETAEPEICLTIDDGHSAAHSTPPLDSLDGFHAPSTSVLD